MKKYIVFLGLFSFLNTGIKAQGFNTLFFIDTCNTVVVSMKILNNYIYVGGYMADYTKYSNGIQSFVTKYDLNGNKISQVKLGDNKYWQWWLESNIEISSNNELLFSCTVRDTSSSTITSLLIVKMDSNLNIKNTFTFDTLGYTYLFGRSILIDKPNGNIYIAGHLQAPPQNANPFILKIDTSLKFKKFVILTNNVLTDVSSNIIIKNDTLLIAINADNMKYVTDPVCEISYKEHFAICDTNCNYISESLTSDTNISFSTSLIPVNTNYFTCGSYVTQRLCSKNHVNISSAIYKWDKDFKLIWKKYYGDTLDGFGLNKIKKAPNENAVLACGMKNVGDITANIYSWDWNGFFVKYDVNGNVLWNREYQGFKDTTRY